MCLNVWLRYANRARNIKNRVTVNRDPNFEKIEKLRARVVELEAQVATLSGTLRAISQWFGFYNARLHLSVYADTDSQKLLEENTELSKAVATYPPDQT